MAISIEKLLKLSQFQKGLQASKDYTDSKVTELNDAKADKATTLAGYGITDTYTKMEVDNKVTSVYTYKGSVDSYADLPTQDMQVGDVYNIVAADEANNVKAGDNVVWNGTGWDNQSGIVDLSGLIKLTDFSAETTGDGNAVTAVEYDPATGKFTAKKEATYLTESDVVINVATDEEVTEVCNAVFGTATA